MTSTIIGSGRSLSGDGAFDEVESKKQPNVTRMPVTPLQGDIQPSAEADAPKPVLGNFELRREIGRGGMGTVYEAWEISLQRTVALKVLARHVASSPAVVKRFQREAQSAAKLHHVHIVPIFAQGNDDGVYYYAMEYIDGPSLHSVINAARAKRIGATPSSDLEETVVLERTQRPSEHDGAADASSLQGLSDSNVVLTAAAEAQGIADHFATIARHISSIADALDYAHARGIVHRDVKPHNLLFGSDARLRIADFGLAQVAEQPGVTLTGEMLGSPLYMSPEQILEGPSSVDHRTDIYSLGATMYEWLTMRAPYPGETREQIIQRITTAEPTPLRTLDSRIPVDLETVCLKAIERDRHRRYQKASELHDDLLRFLDNQPIMARRANLASRLRKAVIRNRLAVLSGVAAAVVIILSWALHTSQRQVQSQAADAAEARHEKEELLDLVNRMRPIELQGTLGLAEAGLEKLVQTGQNVTSFLTEEPKDADIIDFGSPKGIARRALEDLYDAVKPAQWPEVAGSDACAPTALEAAADRDAELEDSRRNVEKCLNAQEQHFEARQLSTLVYGRLKWYDSMLEEAKKLVDIREQDRRPYLWLGLAQILLGHAEEAIAALDRAEQLDESSPWGGTLRAMALLQANRPTDAVVDLAEALNRAPKLPVALLVRAAAHAMVGNLNSAIGDLTTVLESEPENTAILRLRGDYHVRLGELDAAIDDFTRAIAISGNTPALSGRLLGAMVARYNQREAQQQPSGPVHETPPTTDQTSSLSEPGWFARNLLPH